MYGDRPADGEDEAGPVVVGRPVNVHDEYLLQFE